MAALALVGTGGKDKIDSALFSLFVNAGVSDAQLDMFGDFGVTSIPMFTHLSKDAESLRPFLKAAIGLDHEHIDPLIAVKAQLDQAKILSVFTAARTSNEVDVKRSAERLASREPPDVTFQELEQLKRAYEATKWKISDACCPSKTFYEYKLNEVQTSFTAEPLSSVSSYAQEKVWKQRPGANTKDMGWDASTSMFKVQRAEFGVHMPNSAEALRSRLQLLGLGFEFAKMKFSSRRSIRTTCMDLWDRYIHFLFGEEVWGLTSFGPTGQPIATPALKHVLGYDFACRTKIAELMNDGDDIATAFNKVCGWSDPPHPMYGKLQQMNFLNNVTIDIGSSECRACSAPCYADMQKASSSSAKRPGSLALGDAANADKPLSKSQKKAKAAAKSKAADKASIAQLKALANAGEAGRGPNGALSNSQKKKLAKGTGKGAAAALAIKNGGKGDQSKGAGRGNLATQTPEGKPICFKYGKGECTNATCTFAHVCQICFKDHPYRVCGPSAER